MQLHTQSKFLTAGSTQLPSGDFVACGIASSSLVDVVVINGRRLAPGDLLPCSSGVSVTAMRSSAGVNARILSSVAGLAASQDMTGQDFPGEDLALVLYSKCDALVPPGPRAPFVVGTTIPAANMATTAATAKLALRVPFSGRAQAQIALRTDNAAPNLNIRFVVRGIQYPVVGQTQGPFESESPIIDWWSSNSAAGVTVSQFGSGLPMSAVYNIGGNGDLDEAFDELQVWLWANGGAPNGTTHVQAEAFGERDR